MPRRGYRGPPPIRFYTPKELRRQPNRQVRQSIRAQQAPIITAQKLADQRAEAARRAMQGFGLAGASILKDAAPMAGDAYRQASEAESRLASGFAGDTAQRVRETVAAQQAQIDRLARGGQITAPPIEARQNAMYAGEGFIPAASNEAQAANAISYAAQQPSIQEGRTLQAIQGNIAQQAQDDQQYTQAMLDLAAKEPELRSQIMHELQQNELAKRQAWVQEQAQQMVQQRFRVTSGQAQQRINLERRGQNIQARETNARLQLSRANLRLAQARDRRAVRDALVQGHRIDSAASHAAGYLIDRNGNPILNKQGKRIPVHSSSGGGGTNTGPGSTAWKQAYRYAQETYVQPNIEGTTTPDPTWTATPYPRMVRYLVGSYGLTRGQARKLLRGMGIKPNTKRG